MKKIIFTLLALVGTMSMNAQVVKLYQGDVLVAKYNASKVDKVVFEEEPATTGTATRTGGVSVNWVQLWENGPKFAEYNIGATSATEYGGYYCWGNSSEQSSDWTGEPGTDDIATALWGSKWRMPTQAELEELLANCEVEWTNVNGVNGRKFTGKGDYLSNSVFLPAAGLCIDGSVSGQGSRGDYWSSTPDGSDRAYLLYFYSGGQYVFSHYRHYGYSVRAVLAEE